MSDDGEKPVDPLASIRYMLPDIESEDAWLGENYRGRQSFANALKVASEDYDCEIVIRPEQGFLRVDCFLPRSTSKPSVTPLKLRRAISVSNAASTPLTKRSLIAGRESYASVASRRSITLILTPWGRNVALVFVVAKIRNESAISGFSGTICVHKPACATKLFQA